MSDIREDVVLAIYSDEAPVYTDDDGEQSPAEWNQLHDTEWLDQGYECWLPSKEHYYTQAEAAIAAAEPHLRRKHRQDLLDELIAATHEEFNWCQECGGPVEWLITLKNKESE